jgi:2-polyprenyl-3-methyl-5-hydroxy-6-metoxy-1,4-benzoquinol methylase
MIDSKTITGLANTNCTFCGLESDQILAQELRRGEGKVLYCTDCDYGFLATNSIIDTKAYYDSEYRKEYSHTAEASPTSPSEMFEIYSRFQGNRLPFIKPVLTPSSKVLEVGAGAGQFLTHIKSDVKTAHAIELDKECCTFLKNKMGIEADSEFLENSRFANEQYDVVCAFQVMEHVEDPIVFLKSLKKVTRPNGEIFIEVPNLRDALLSVWDVQSHRKFFYHSAHLHYFTENTLKKIAQNAGFNIENIEINYTQDYNLLNHLHWIMNDSPQENCMVGMSNVHLNGIDDEIPDWLSGELKLLNGKYIDRLVANKQTSNILAKLKND